MADEKEPRRWKLPSEYGDEDRANRAGRRSAIRPERQAYIEWREAKLRDERDDLELRQRLLREEAEVLRTQAADAQLDALELRCTTGPDPVRPIAPAARKSLPE